MPGSLHSLERRRADIVQKTGELGERTGAARFAIDAPDSRERSAPAHHGGCDPRHVAVHVADV